MVAFLDRKEFFKQLFSRAEPPYLAQFWEAGAVEQAGLRRSARQVYCEEDLYRSQATIELHC
jgi:hypothetical protein